MEGDLGWVPPQIHIHLDILRLWNRLVGLSMAESRLPKILYHHMLNGGIKFYFWCTKWRMVVNKEKTHIIHFRPKTFDRTNNEFKYGDSIIDIVSYCKYNVYRCNI